MTKYIKKQSRKTKKNQKGKGPTFSKPNPNKMTKKEKEDASDRNSLKQFNKETRYLKELFKKHPELSKQDINDHQTMAVISARNTAKNVKVGGTNDCKLRVEGSMIGKTNSWGDFAYNRQFYLNGDDCQTGWIVQSIERETEATDVSGKKYNDNDSILSLTTKQVKESNNKYVELFRVEGGDTIGEYNKKPENDEFASGPIKKYYLKNNKYTTNNNNGSDDTSGLIKMNSSAYFIKSTEEIDNKIKDIGQDVHAANGLRSNYGLQLYTDLEHYKSSNVWCCDLYISWTGGDESDDKAGDNCNTIREYSYYDNNKRSMISSSLSEDIEPSNKRSRRSSTRSSTRSSIRIGGKRKLKISKKRKTRKGKKTRKGRKPRR